MCLDPILWARQVLNTPTTNPIHHQYHTQHHSHPHPSRVEKPNDILKARKGNQHQSTILQRKIPLIHHHPLQPFSLSQHSHLLPTRIHHHQHQRSLNCHIRAVLDLAGLKANSCIIWSRICRCRTLVDRFSFSLRFWLIVFFCFTWTLVLFLLSLSLVCWRFFSGFLADGYGMAMKSDNNSSERNAAGGGGW